MIRLKGSGGGGRQKHQGKSQFVFYFFFPAFPLSQTVSVWVEGAGLQPGLALPELLGAVQRKRSCSAPILPVQPQSIPRAPPPGLGAASPFLESSLGWVVPGHPSLHRAGKGVNP